MEILTRSCADKSYVSITMGDFNLDENKKNNTNYSHSRYFDLLQDKFNELSMIQLIKFNTWSKIIRGVFKNSILDHI